MANFKALGRAVCVSSHTLWQVKIRINNHVMSSFFKYID